VSQGCCVNHGAAARTQSRRGGKQSGAPPPPARQCCPARRRRRLPPTPRGPRARSLWRWRTRSTATGGRRGPSRPTWPRWGCSRPQTPRRWRTCGCRRRRSVGGRGLGGRAGAAPRRERAGRVAWMLGEEQRGGTRVAQRAHSASENSRGKRQQSPPSPPPERPPGLLCRVSSGAAAPRRTTRRLRCAARCRGRLGGGGPACAALCYE
jgi:hypothetical protein